MRVKKWGSKVRRFFSLNKKQLHYDDSTKDSQSVKKTLPWSPEDIMDELHGAPIDDQMRGVILLLEMGGGEDDQGWVMDFSGKDDEDKIIISRYDVPPSRVKSKKTPSGPPPGTYSFKSSDEESLDLPSLPWVWYKDRKTFSKIETGKLSDMVAFVTGRIAASGDPSKWEGIDDSWKAAKESAEKKKKLQIPSGGDRDDNGDDEEEEEEAVDEEAKIIATYRPEVPPRDPRKKEFWKRHLGTDFLVASYLFLIGSIAFNISAIHRLVTDINPHSIANALMATFFTFASVYFIKLSYPESIMLMAYHVMTIEPESMTFIQRYFTANEMLIALWFFTGGFVVPYVFVILWELLVSHQYHKALVDTITTIVSIPLTGVLNFSAMPDAMRANGGRGSSYFFDKFWVPLLCLKNSESRYAFWNKHVGNDGLAGGWIFAVLGVVGGIVVLPLVILHPLSAHDWYLFWATIPFTIGSLLLVRASYPENMNTSLLFSDEGDEEDDQGEGDGSGKKVSFNDESTPLL